MAELFVTAYLAALYLQLGIKVPVLRPVLILGIAVLVSGIAYLSAKDRPVIFDRHIRIMFLILVFAGISTVGAFIQRDALDVWIKMANRFIYLFFLVNVIDGVAKFRRLIATMVVVHFALALDGIRAFHTTVGRGAQEGLSGRLGGFLGDANDFGLAINMFLPYAYFLLFAARKTWVKVALATSIGVSAVALMFTFSRGAFLTLAALVLYFVVKSPKRAVGLSVGAALALAALLVMPPSYWERIHTIGEGTPDGSVQGRLWAWEAGWKMALDQPVLGMGPGNFRTGYGRFYKPEAAGDAGWEPNRWTAAHSSYFQAMGEMGFVGFGLLGFLVVYCWTSQSAIQKRLRDHDDLDDDGRFSLAMAHATQASLLAFLVGAAFLGAIYYPHLWLNAALTQVLVVTVAQPVTTRDAPRATLGLRVVPRGS